MVTQIAPTLESLQDMFPAMPRSFLQDVLEQAGDKALDVLMPASEEVCTKAYTATTVCKEGPPSPVHPQGLELIEPCPFTPHKPVAQPAGQEFMAMLFSTEQLHCNTTPTRQPATILTVSPHQLKVSPGDRQGSDMQLDNDHLDFGVRTPTLGTPHRAPSHDSLVSTFQGWQTMPKSGSTSGQGLSGTKLSSRDTLSGCTIVRGWWPAYTCDGTLFEADLVDVVDSKSLEGLEIRDAPTPAVSDAVESASILTGSDVGGGSGAKRCRHEPADSILMELIQSAQSLGPAKSPDPGKCKAAGKSPGPDRIPTPIASPFTTCAVPPSLSSHPIPPTPSNPLVPPTLTNPLLQHITAEKPPASTFTTTSDQSCGFLLDMLPQPEVPTAGEQHVDGAGRQSQMQPAASTSPFCVLQQPTSAAADDPPRMSSEQQIAHFRSMFPSLPAHTISSVTQLYDPEQILEMLLKIQAAFDQPQAYDSEAGLREAVTPPSPRSLQPSWEAYSESSDSPSDPLAGLSMQEKVEHLRASFPSINPEEVMNALRDENGRPDRAAALLQLYVQEDAQEQDADVAAAADEEFCRQLILEESQAKEREQADAKLAKQLLDEEYASRQDQAVSNSQPSSVSPYQTKPPPPPPPKRKQWKEVVSQRSKAKLQHLNRCYPETNQDILASTLAASGNDIRSCKQLLSQAGNTERKVRAFAKADGLDMGGAVHRVYAAKPMGPRDGQHQALYEETRKLANQYREEARGWFQKSTEAKNKRQPEVSASYTRMGLDLMAKAKRENDLAAQRIFRGVNRTVNVWECDVHGLHIPEALKKVTELIAQMTTLGGPVHLKIITGQGHHSVDNTPKIWPAMKQFLEQRSLDYRTFPGYFVVPLNTLEAP